MKILSSKRYAELKGYYSNAEATSAKNVNLYINAISSYLKGIELPPIIGVSRDAIADLYVHSSNVMGVIGYIADNVGEVMRYLELSKDGKPVEKHWIIDLLKRPNDRFSTRKFGQAWAINKLLFGDAWTYAIKAIGKDKGAISEMYVIPSHRIAIDRAGEVQPLKGVRLIGTATQQDIMSSDIFESFDYNLDDTTFFGTSKIVAAALYLTVMERGMNREATSLKNGGVANLVTPAKDTMGIMPKDADDVQASINDKDNAGKTMALRIPIDVHELGNKPIDLNILESHKEAITALCFVYKIPVDLYYGQSKYENYKESKKTIYEQNAIPLANEFAEDLLRYSGLDSEGYDLRVNTDEIDVLKDKASDTLDNLTKMHATLNEMREAYGYERIEEPYADQPMVPMNTVFGNDSINDINEIDPNA